MLKRWSRDPAVGRAVLRTFVISAKSCLYNIYKKTKLFSSFRLFLLHLFVQLCLSLVVVSGKRLVLLVVGLCCLADKSTTRQL